ncbi:energy-coupling factor ABC transporter ATP-binding protein [Atopococcus tabaci]|uniref:energy-coupling factor ABC transporter ATP-binding protein n=1 Tax=Atopococcus tabaci TaxID=269774 RepID=UPI00041B2633|nr:ATP-binding cassette domain-containing protein [Atopococcus tabaci]
MSIIQVQELKYRYPDTERLALDNVSFEIEQGEFIGIVGRNKSGKSTLCYALAGLAPHFFGGGYGGKVVVNGLEIRASEIEEITSDVGLVFENPFSQMTGSKFTVFEEIAFGLENKGIDRTEMVQRIEESLFLLDIEEIKNKNPFSLSGGQMQRVAIASVIAMKPNVLILDEPTSQLDPQGSEDVFRVVENLAKEGITIVMAEHKIEKVAQYSDRVLLLDDGKLVDINTPEHIFSRDDLETHGILAPAATRIAQALDIRDPLTGLYPVTLAGIQRQRGEI